MHREYDKANNVVKNINAKLNETSHTLTPATARRIETDNRIVTSRYDQNSNLLTLSGIEEAPGRRMGYAMLAEVRGKCVASSAGEDSDCLPAADAVRFEVVDVVEHNRCYQQQTVEAI